MKKSDVQDTSGFTVIEVSLVLAIAGLIFMMVFIALPALNRSQRDTQRRDDVMTLLSNIKKYQQNNRGSLPSSGTEAHNGGSETNNKTSWQDFYNNYLGDKFVDPSGGHYRLNIASCDKESCNDTLVNSILNSSFPYNDYTMVVFLRATCDGERAVPTSNTRNLAVMYRLEGAGTYCNNM